MTGPEEDRHVFPISGAIRCPGARLITLALIVFPARHHSPGCVWHLWKRFPVRRDAARAQAGFFADDAKGNRPHRRSRQPTATVFLYRRLRKPLWAPVCFWSKRAGNCGNIGAISGTHRKAISGENTLFQGIPATHGNDGPVYWTGSVSPLFQPLRYGPLRSALF
ncbi:MAG: hypothetical protein LBL59_02650 [Xanthomonadaceae bacterium]|nr:hypothetical protein [Xanthomonadaceae bacterium]